MPKPFSRGLGKGEVEREKEKQNEKVQSIFSIVGVSFDIANL